MGDYQRRISLRSPRGGVPAENSENPAELAATTTLRPLTLNVTEAPEITDYKSGHAIAPPGNQCGKLVGAGRSHRSSTGGYTEQ